MQIDLATVQRNRMLAQRTVFWQAERQACANTIKILDENIDYRTSMNILANYICCTVILWAQESEIIQGIIDVGLNNESALAIWRDADPSVKTVENWLARGRRWKVEECSELFRVLVSVVEVLSNQDKKLKVPMLKGQSKDFQFVSGDLPRFKSTYEIDKKVLIESIEQAMTAVKNTKDHGIDIFKKKRESGGSVDPSQPRSRASTTDVIKRITELSNDNVDSKRRFTRLLSYSSGGTNIHSIKPDSILGVIEWIYGLPGGADVSGTTAEIISLTGFVSSYLPKDEINAMIQGVPWYLGPVLAMVKNGHHTFLECAVAMYYGEKLRVDSPVLPFVPGQYNSIKTAFDDPSSSDLAKAVIEALEDKAQDVVYLFKPDTGAWTDTENQISLLGGTITNNYSYWEIPSKYRPQFNAFTIQNIIEEAGDAFSDSGDPLIEQMNTLYSGIKSKLISD